MIYIWGWLVCICVCLVLAWPWQLCSKVLGTASVSKHLFELPYFKFKLVHGKALLLKWWSLLRKGAPCVGCREVVGFKRSSSAVGLWPVTRKSEQSTLENEEKDGAGGVFFSPCH
jgi:hypothetical protein